MVERGELSHMMDEAVEVTEKLASDAQAAHQHVDKWMDRAKILSDRVDLVSDESHAALTDGITRYEKLDQELAHEAEETKAAFETITQRAKELETHVDELLGKVHSHVEHLHGVREQIHGRIQEESEHHQQELAALSALVAQFEHKVEDHWSGAHDEIKLFVSQLDEHLDDFKEHHDKHVADVDAFNEDHNNLFQGVVENLSGFGEHSGELLANLVSHVEGLTGEHAGALGAKFGSEVVENLMQAADPLSGAFNVLHELAGGSHESVLGKFEEITGHLGSVTDIIDQIKPALDLIEEML
jgi:DNA repair exonuclease SbcCD ATPase subunit